MNKNKETYKKLTSERSSKYKRTHTRMTKPNLKCANSYRREFMTYSGSPRFYRAPGNGKFCQRKQETLFRYTDDRWHCMRMRFNRSYCWQWTPPFNCQRLNATGCARWAKGKVPIVNCISGRRTNVHYGKFIFIRVCKRKKNNGRKEWNAELRLACYVTIATRNFMCN